MCKTNYTKRLILQSGRDKNYTIAYHCILIYTSSSLTNNIKIISCLSTSQLGYEYFSLKLGYFMKFFELL